MTMANLFHVAHCGLPEIDRVLFRAHGCHVYGSRNQLVAPPALAASFEEQVWSRL